MQRQFILHTAQMAKALLLAGFSFIALPLQGWAEEAHQDAEHASGLPQLDYTTFGGQIFWLAITFTVLLLLLWKIALPRVAEVLEARHLRISEDLERAQAARDEAAKITSDIEKLIGDARQKAQAFIAKETAQIAEMQAKEEAKFVSQMEERLNAAEARIDAARTQALANIRDVAVEVAQAAIERLSGKAVEPAQIQLVVDQLSKE